ncbi:MAG: PadR family transcriptional regulator [Polyangiaceae bacterium]
MQPHERAILLLGMIKSQRSHGYLVNDFIEKNLTRVADMKKATAYATLDKLAKDGFVNVTTEQVGNRPPRKVYELTPAGEAHLYALIRRSLRDASPLRFGSDAAVMFLDEVPLADAIEALRGRLHDRTGQLAAYQAAPKHGMGLGVDMALDHVKVHVAAEVEWLQRTIAALEAELAAREQKG